MYEVPGKGEDQALSLEELLFEHGEDLPLTTTH